MTAEESLKELSLDILLELHAEATKHLSESKRKMDTPEVVKNYQNTLELIQKVIIEKKAATAPFKVCSSKSVY